ncbi:MAG: Na/Pi cotransporter family protein [Clostridia bacterium]|nr:Na/Pi cotransporter family protein [Clostridia bacterium]
MGFSDVLSLIGGLCLFLFGMQIMGNGLEKRAGSKLSGLIGKLTTNRMKGLLTGLGVTAVIQSSSATTVMVVGFVNSGVMTLKQAINVIMGANVGTTVTAWLLSLIGIDGGNFFIAMLKPANFTPILALIGILLYMGSKSDKKKDIGSILLGFSTLMFGMETMSGAVSGLSEVPEFRNILLMFSNPLLGVFVGALFTAIIQSSSASVGVLQALSSTGQVTVGTAIPIVLGQNIGTCITALLSAIGANKNAKRAALVHLSFNIIGCTFWIIIYMIANQIFRFAFTSMEANAFNIAVIHTVFNVASTACMLPLAGFLEKLACRIVPDNKNEEEKESLLDKRLLSTPAFAIDNCRKVSFKMADATTKSLLMSIDTLIKFDKNSAEKIRKFEDETDKYEDQIGSYLVNLCAKPLSKEDSHDATKILHMIGDFERISDHAVNIVESAEEMISKNFDFSASAKKEISVLLSAVKEIVVRTYNAYRNDDVKTALSIEPLEQVIDDLKEQIRTRHILRLQAGDCSLEVGFVLSDLLTSLERVADHCSNIAGCIIEMRHDALDLHEYLGKIKTENDEFRSMYTVLKKEYSL